MVVRSRSKIYVGVCIIWFVMQLQLCNIRVTVVHIDSVSSSVTVTTETKVRELQCYIFDLICVSAMYYSVVSCKARSVLAT
jgi:hypothetical protein